MEWEDKINPKFDLLIGYVNFNQTTIDNVYTIQGCTKCDKDVINIIFVHYIIKMLSPIHLFYHFVNATLEILLPKKIHILCNEMSESWHSIL